MYTLVCIRIAGVGIRCEDLPPSHLSKKMNWLLLAVIGPPEPPDLGAVLPELLDDIYEAGLGSGIQVTDANGREFRHFVYLSGWYADAQGRRKVWQRGSPNGYRGCGECRLVSSLVKGTTLYPGGYAKPVQVQMPNGVMEDVYAGDVRLLLSHSEMLEQERHVEWMKSQVKSGSLPQARLDEVKTASGCFGTCKVSARLPYVNLPTFFNLPTGHMLLFGLVKTYWRGYASHLGSGGFKILKLGDERRRHVKIPSDLQRPVKLIYALSATSATTAKALSGWVMEDVWHDTETICLLIYDLVIPAICFHYFR